MAVGTFVTPLAGGSFRRGVNWADIKPGDQITIRRDPFGQTTNTKHKDPNALAVYRDGLFIGYLPANRAKVLAPAIDRGDVFISGRIRWIAGPTNVHLVCTIMDKLPTPVTDEMIRAAAERAKHEKHPVEAQGE